ncbi:bifunctional allantoicase/(S)-ureidoglycine aminohydrolase [Bradyrhizobium sp. CB3481]|uniref:bifunctional allantoicase/(S)-ureidoglycine aminohydrolase n=1 Tax=Bradyrhizobium sp. CB3481 TaxID=3039158 RepID=UPI0024B214D0|nr:bifunctional allantoicase/(S)-ureidoglycine aminohydrolase [Bradyrhizobium sp. CB3481]WFU14618.1 bifunctional allantoicase/(S)-ureidoglycine aminohydrolase [Bradyrhizobium sp. CB3481]
MQSRSYHVPRGGHPAQTELSTGRAVCTDAYAVIPNGVLRDIVTSYLPHCDRTRDWVLARPLSGFAETFSHYLVEVAPGGGSDMPEPDRDAEGVLFVVGGSWPQTCGSGARIAAGWICLPPCRLRMEALQSPLQSGAFHWIRKLYQPVPGLAVPDVIFANEEAMIDADARHGERWATTRFVDPADLRHDMHVNIITFEPGASIPFAETHVMEHGLYVLEGKAVYRLNRDWVEVEAGDYMWLRAFCPQACYAGGRVDSVIHYTRT